jgi:hypothetical protein
VEAYGLLDADPAGVHGTWQTAGCAVTKALAEALPSAELEADLAAATAAADRPPVRQLHTGSGWGALEQRRRRLAGEPALPDSGTPFGSNTLGAEQDPWLGLLESNRLDVGDAPPATCVSGGDWSERLARVPANWLGCYLRALLAHSAGDAAMAECLYTSSQRHRENPWSLRGLALLRAQAGDLASAADHYLKAHRLAPGHPHLAKETVAALLRAQRPDDAFRVVTGLPDEVRSRGRFRMLEAQAAAASGDEERARAILDAGVVVDDLREGETALDALWTALRPGVEVPAQYDFRMRTA